MLSSAHMNEEEIIRNEAQLIFLVTPPMGTEAYVKELVDASLRFRKPENKAIYFDVVVDAIRGEQEKHRSSCPIGPGCDEDKRYEKLLYFLQEEINALPENASNAISKFAIRPEPAPSTLANLHPIIQQAAGSLYATGHYRQAILDAYIAVDNAVGDKSQLPGSGTRLMEAAFSPGNPVLKIGDSPEEQQGFMALFRGAMLAIRNPKAHSLGGTQDAQRALEWLSFASVLLRNLDEAVLQQPIPPSA